MPEPDPIQAAHRQVQEITDSDPVNGEELLGSPELRRQLREAKERLRERRFSGEQATERVNDQATPKCSPPVPSHARRSLPSAKRRKPSCPSWDDPHLSALLRALKLYIRFLLPFNENLYKISGKSKRKHANKRLSKERQALILSAICEGMPVNAVSRMFKTDKGAILRVMRETGEAFADYMDKNFRDLPCERIELDEQWQYVGCHAGRMIAPRKGRGDFWLWAAIDADTKLVFSHRIGKRNWITGNMFVEDVSERVSGPVQIATDNLPAYPFHIRNILVTRDIPTEQKQRYSASQTTRRHAGALGRNEGVRKMQTAERKAVVGSPDLETSPRAISSAYS